MYYPVYSIYIYFFNYKKLKKIQNYKKLKYERNESFKIT